MRLNLKLTVLCCAGLLSAAQLGCGGSSSDPWAAAARRVRTPEPEVVVANNPTPESEAATDPNSSNAETGAGNGAVATVPTPMGNGDATVVGDANPDLSTLLPPSDLAETGRPETMADYLERMNKIGEAFTHDINETSMMPVRVTFDNDGEPILSWRVRILPQLGYQELYDKFRHDQPWNSPHNLQLVPYMPKVYQSGANKPGLTCFQVPVDPFSAFPHGLPPKLVDVTHGIGASVLLVQTSPAKAVVWTAPEDYLPPPSNAAQDLARTETGNYLVLWGSGNAEEIKGDAGFGLYRCMLTIRGPKEQFSPFDLAVNVPMTQPMGEDAELARVSSEPSGGVSTEIARPGVSLDSQGKLQGFVQERMSQGEFEHAAELLQLSQLLASDAIPVGKWNWLPATQTLRESPRIGLGVTAAIGGRIREANPVVGYLDQSTYRWEDVTKTTGDVGQAVINRVMAMMEQGALGSAQLAPQVNAPGVRRGTEAGQNRFLAAGFEYVGNERLPKLLEMAQYRRLDLLLHLEVELALTRQNVITNRTTVFIYDVRSRRPLFESSPVSNVQVARSAADLSIENPLDKMQVELQQYLDQNVRLDANHVVSVDEAKARVDLESFESEKPDWARALECRELLRLGLIGRVEFEQAFAAACKIDWQAYQAADEKGRLDLLLAPQDSSVALAVVQAMSWVPKELRSDAVESGTD